MPRKPPGFAEHVAPLLPPEPANPPLPGAEGHRSRMRSRLLTAGPEALADHELLEMLLFIALPRRDTKPVARALLHRFRSFAGALAAPVNDLRQVDGLGEAGIAAIKTVQAAALRMMRAEIMDRPVLNNWDGLMGYLNAVLAREPIEHFRVLFLDARNRLLADEPQGRGTIDHTPVYPREVVRRALELQATALILVHNHPSGEVNPSKGDLEMTQYIKHAAQLMRVTLHDHIIVGNGKWLSLRQQGLL